MEHTDEVTGWEGKYFKGGQATLKQYYADDHMHRPGNAAPYN